MADLHASGSLGPQGGHIGSVLGTGLIQLIAGDVLRPGLPWLLATASPARMAEEMARVRDPEGIAELKALRETGVVADSTFLPAVERIALIMAAKGGGVRDITPGDCLELLKHCREVFTGGGQANRHSPFFYQLLHTAGVFPASAPPTVRIFSTRFPGQLTPGQLVDRYDLACRPVRDLLVDYLRERQPGIDYNTLTGLASALALRFWKDLETHHPGISSLRLAPDIAAAWKQRIQTRTVRSPGSPGQVIESATARKSADGILTTVRAFYLDLAQWALDEPSRWGPWAVPCPIRAGDIQHKKEKTRRKARMDQRTRQLLPLLPAVTQAAGRAREAAAARFQAAIAAAPGELFTAGGQTLSRARMSRYSPPHLGRRARHRQAPRPHQGRRQRLLGLGRHRSPPGQGIRIEELTELSHHSLVQYRLPASGELVPLLQIAPSKTDEERLLVISPELADVLSTIICRIRTPGGSVPLVVAYDAHECVWNPPMPLLFQRIIGLENRPIPIAGIRDLIHSALASARLTGTDGKPLDFAPHDFRRIFTTEAIMNGMPPHIAQLILGHRDINTTMGYKAVYPEEAINGHRAFIARRRALRPSEEYRSPTDEEWEEFSATSNAAASRSATAAAPTAPAASTSIPASAARSCASTPPSGPGWPPSATTSPRASPRPNAKAGPGKAKPSRSASPPLTPSSPRPTASSPAAQLPTSASPPTATSPTAPRPSRKTRHNCHPSITSPSACVLLRTECPISLVQRRIPAGTVSA
jgi:integrase